ncbi:MAG: TorF family putative porin [Hyphomicrobiales bacterium]|nr:TorF family putative porin [Hyphomicrobiales bacterium]
MQEFLKALRAGMVGATAIVAASGAASAADLSYKDDPVVEEARKFGISFYAAATTDYVFRGLSQTAEEGTVQAAVDLTYGIAYFGIWGSGIDFEDPAAADVELDIYAGIKPTWKNITFDFGAIYYYYPGANDGGAETDYVEFKAGASGTVWDGLTAGVTVYYSPDFSFETGEAWTVEGTVAKTLPKLWKFDLVASGTLGYTDVDDLGDYVYWNLGLTKTWSKFSLDVRYWDTDLDVGNNNFGCSNNDAFSCDERVVGTFKVTLP